MNAKTAARAAATQADPRWAAVVARDRSADGAFYFSVKTTGVYCRPSCASRQARPENVAFHATAAAAELAGFRPCKRCKPDAQVAETIRFTSGPSSLGVVLVAQSRNGLCAVLIGDDLAGLARDLQLRFPRALLADGGDEMQPILASVIDAIEMPAHATDLKLDLRGTPFQRRVWQALLEIPAGETASYTAIAERICAPAAVRAVAGACAANALAVLIPCHRVLRRDGGLSGYRWGIERKRALLERELRA